MERKHTIEGESKKGVHSLIPHNSYLYTPLCRKDEQEGMLWSFSSFAEAFCFTASVSPK